MELHQLLEIMINIDKSLINHHCSEISVDDMLVVCTILDSQRQINFINARLKFTKDKQKVNTLKNKLENLQTLQTYNAQNITLTKTRKNLVKEWASLQPTLICSDAWIKLADLIHFNPIRDFKDPLFLKSCFKQIL